ncbi:MULTISPECIES: helix-turn-helix transcriptional regulator [Bacteroidales]|jgi:DNA-binding transcriptional ArsR family regulator|uniref:ArsR/SmtB family transcription factor n=1 Tax=Bacteroidales TaxID=171549 RepID=UPI0013D29161|nr:MULTISPECIES: winged helix-turn-helix domain-containing protein [Bacteroidales]MDH6357727.1 ArsR family transcriptional regulator [Parabacteroides sp. PF5-9]NDV67056.1 ArsR family transcriptional regulator [Bacteroides sp. 224]NDV67498.1 ArsR family transcriptional regulator [Dysgonomonas sp. 25]
MAFSKAEQFDEKDVAIARYAKALSHPARVAILRLLSKQDYCYCGDIVEDLPIAQSTVSQHLKELKNAGLIEGEITPPKVRYCISKEHYTIAKQFFKELFE